MIAVADCDILSTFAKINRIELLEKIFSKILMSHGVYIELTNAETFGFDFPEKVFKSRIELTTLNSGELNDFKFFVKMPQIHHGEAECMSIAKNRNMVFLTNDRKAVRLCEETGILVLDIKDVLKQIAREKLIDKNEMLQILDDVERLDNTVIKEKEEIIKECI